MKFIRFGGLSSVKQKGYTNDESKIYDHTPPARRGIYAFTYPYVEPFLLGGISGKGEEVYIKNRKGERYYTKMDKFHNKIETNIDKDFPKSNSYNCYYINGEERVHKAAQNFMKYFTNKWIEQPDGTIMEYYMKPLPRHIFDYNGELWCHDFNNVKPKKILARHGDWIKVNVNDFEKSLNKERLRNRVESGKGDINATRKVNGCYSIDYFEVFIEKVK